MASLTPNSHSTRRPSRQAAAGRGSSAVAIRFPGGAANPVGGRDRRVPIGAHDSGECSAEDDRAARYCGIYCGFLGGTCRTGAIARDRRATDMVLMDSGRILRRKEMVGIEDLQEAVQLGADHQHPLDVISGAGHVHVVQSGEPRGAEEIDGRQIQDESSPPRDLSFHVTGERATVGRVDLAPDRDEHRGVRQMARRKDCAMVVFASVERRRIGSEHATGTHCRQGGLTQPKSDIRTGVPSGMGPPLQSLALGSQPDVSMTSPVGC
jgi:hypothetical protein